MTAHGVGPITALTYKAEIHNPLRFSNSRAVGAYLGMTPKQYSSEKYASNEEVQDAVPASFNHC